MSTCRKKITKRHVKKRRNNQGKHLACKNYYSTQETLHWRPWFFRCNEHPLLKGKDRSPQTSRICKLFFFFYNQNPNNANCQMDHSPQWNVLSVFVSNLNRLLLQRRAASQDFPLVFLFPEGTTTNGRALISFKLGAFVPGFPVQPVVVRYPFVHLDVSW